MFKSSSNHVLSAIFATFSQKSHLNRKIIFFRFFSIGWMFPNFHASIMNGDCHPSYVKDIGGKTGGKVGGDVPSLSPALSQVLSPDEEKDASIDAKDATSSSKVAALDEKVASLEPKDTKVKKKA